MSDFQVTDEILCAEGLLKTFKILESRNQLQYP